MNQCIYYNRGIEIIGGIKSMTREDRIIYEAYLKTDEWKKKRNRDE